MSGSEADWSVLTDEEQDTLHGLMAKAGMGGLGAMTDASKRRGAVMSEPAGKRYTMQVMRGPIGSAGHVGMAVGQTPKGASIYLPPGVDDLTVWGRTVVMFGKFQSLHLSYADLVSSTKLEEIQYVKWCSSRVDSSGGELLDFALFIHAYWAQQSSADGPSQLPLIPGSATVRQFK